MSVPSDTSHVVVHLCMLYWVDRTAVDSQAEEVPIDVPDLLVPLPSLYRALSFGRNLSETKSTFESSQDNVDVPIAEDTEVTKDKLSLVSVSILLYSMILHETLYP